MSASVITPMLTESDLVEMSLEGAAAAFARGITAEELTKAFLERIAFYNPRYNAIITMNPTALDDAREIDRQRAVGEKLGPLAGVPVVIKDTMDMAGLPTTAGWHFLSSKAGGVDLIPETDSPVVARMKAAGCVILGKTNVPILSATGTHASNSWAGPTLNAAAPDRMPGGSTAGTATAVAASMAVLGLAEETGGSIQNPASAQALVGIKPTFALVPNAGVVPLAGSTRDVVGPIARSVRDAALTLDVIAGYSSEDPKTVAGIGKRPKGGYASKLSTTALQGKRLGLYGPGWRNHSLSEECTALYKHAQEEIAARGATLLEDPFAGSGFAAIGKPISETYYFDARGMECCPYDMELYLRRLGPSATIKDYKTLAEITKSEDPYGHDGVLTYMNCLPETEFSKQHPTVPPPLTEFVSAREAYLEIVEEVFAKHQLDGLVFPQMCNELPFLNSNGVIDETTVSEINIAGVPVVTVPAGYYVSGAPFNLVFVGKLWCEADLLALAYDYEKATNHRKAPALSAQG
jgi:Asp-tRNA(Asn)/Glu-tRNA(Gln) amidotransferase A subunit family amidase